MTLGNLHVNQHKNIIVSDKNPTVQKCIITVILVIISLIHSQVYLWADKYRPRKPRFFNRVHTVCFSLFWLCQQVLIAYYTIFSDKLWTLFEQKHPLPSLSLKLPTLLSQSVTVSLLASCCVGVEEGRSGKSQCHSRRTNCIIHTNLHFESFSNFLGMLANFSLPYYTLPLRAGLQGR